MVAPLAGARIEIEMVAIGSAWLLVAPLAGARIEITTGSHSFAKERCRSPRGSAD